MFNERMSYKPKDKQPFMNYGPLLIDGKTHSSVCALLLYTSDKDQLKTFRTFQDPYPYDTNFGHLPEIKF